MISYHEDEPQDHDEHEEDAPGDEEHGDLRVCGALAAGHGVLGVKVEVHGAHDDHGHGEQEGEEAATEDAGALLRVVGECHLGFVELLEDEVWKFGVCRRKNDCMIGFAAFSKKFNGCQIHI